MFYREHPWVDGSRNSVTHEDDAVRALLTAEDMHRELERVKRFLGPDAAQLSLHVGVNTGHAVARTYGSDLRIDYSVLGDCVNTAQRLEAVAEAGETIVGSMTHELTRDGFEIESVGELLLKGKASGVDARRLIGRRRSLVQSVLERGPIELLGRDREVTLASAALTDLLGCLRPWTGSLGG